MRKAARRFLAFFLLFIAIFSGIAGYARFIEPNLLTVRTLSIETEKEIVPCKIVFFSDTHFGKLYDVSHAREIVEKINALQADFVVFGGDLFDHYARDREAMDFAYLQAELSKIEAKAGKFAVWGNHDYGGGAVRVYERFITSCGFELLKDESRLLKNYGIKIVGFDDSLLRKPSPALATVEDAYFSLFIAHEPIVSEVLQGEGEHLLLAGHTHGGQVYIPFLTKHWLPEGSGRFRKGFYSAKTLGTGAAFTMFVSSGIGMTRYPFRFLNVPEIVQIKLTRVK